MTDHRLLVVEDEVLIAEDLVSLLHQVGYMDVTVCHSLAKAKSVLENQGFDLALVDIMFKNKKDGLVLGRLLREEYHIPHIFVTAHSDKAVLDRAATTHPAGYIVKPVEEEQLRISIRMALNRHQLERQLAEQEHFNRLRGDIWEVANHAESTDDLVFRILHILGPAVRVHRAAFFERDEERKNFVLRQQWHKKDVEATPGVQIPYVFTNAYLNKKIITITAASLPPVIKRAARKMLDRYGVRAMLVVPFGSGGDIRGFFSFTECLDENRQWTPEEQDILTETTTIFDAVSDRLQAERKVAEEGDRARQYLEMAATIFVSLDRSGTVTMINRKGLDFLGYTEKEVIGRNWFQTCIPRKQRPEIQAVYRQLMDGEIEAPEYYENTVITRDKKERLVRWQSIYIRNNDGSVSGTLSAGSDITEQQRSQQLLDALNQASRAMEDAVTQDDIFNAITRTLHRLGLTCIIMPYNPDTGTLAMAYISMDGKIIRAAEKLVGIKTSDFTIRVADHEYYRNVVDRRCTELMTDPSVMVHKMLPARVRKLIPALLKILRLPHAIGAPLIVDNRVAGVFSVQSPSLTERDIPAVTAFAHQVSAAWHKARLLDDLQRHLDELKKTQEQLLFSQKQQAIGQLAGGVAHDFNNLLTVIKGNAELVMRKVGEDHPLERYLRPLHESAERAAELTRQLLMYSRKAPMEHTPVDLNRSIETVRKMLVRVIGENIRIKTSLNTGLARIPGDPGTLQQVLMNLAINARDAMPDGGTLTIETDSTVITGNEEDQWPEMAPGPYVLLTVSDTGQGMSEQVRGHVFDPFFTTKEVGKGTGLGLSVVYGVIQQHNGRITVESEPGKGTVFRIWLPAGPEETHSPKKTGKKEETVQGSARRILLVEDEPGVRGFVTEALTEHDFIVVPVGSAAAARDAYAGDPKGFDLVFSDVVLPDENGIALADAILHEHPEQKVILTSGYTDDRSRLEEIGRRNLLFLPKPFTLSDLLRTVQKCLERS